MEFCLIQQMCHIHFIIYSPYITKEELPAQNQALYRYKAKGPSPVQNQEPFTGTEPRAALLEPNHGTLTGTEPKGRYITTKTKAFHEYRTKGRPTSKVLHQRPFTSTEPKTALMIQNQTRRIKFKKVSRYVL